MTTPDDRAGGPHPARGVIIFAVVVFAILFILGALAVRSVVLSNYRHDEERHQQRPGAMQTEKPGPIASIEPDFEILPRRLEGAKKNFLY